MSPWPLSTESNHLLFTRSRCVFFLVARACIPNSRDVIPRAALLARRGTSRGRVHENSFGNQIIRMQHRGQMHPAREQVQRERRGKKGNTWRGKEKKEAH